MLLASKQIEKFISTRVGLSGFAASGNSNNITAALSTALNTAGNGGVSVPVQPSTGVSVQGVITTGNNKVMLKSTANDDILDGDNVVYGRITESGGVYTLTYYTDVSGVETAFSMPSQSISVWFGYRFTFEKYPADAAINLPLTEVDKQGAGGGTADGRMKVELLTVTATNTISDLSLTPVAAGEVLLSVNGKTEDGAAGGAFSVSGKAITWSAVNAGYSVATTDRVIAFYSTLE